MWLDRGVQGRRAASAAAGGGRRRRGHAHPGRRAVRRSADLRRPVATPRRDGRPGSPPGPAHRAHRGCRCRRCDRRRTRDRTLAGRDGQRDRERCGDRGLPRHLGTRPVRAGDGRRHVDPPGDARQRQAPRGRVRLPDGAARGRLAGVGPVRDRPPRGAAGDRGRRRGPAGRQADPPAGRRTPARRSWERRTSSTSRAGTWS